MPLVRMQVRVILAERRGANPFIPVQTRWNGKWLGARANTAIGAVGPTVGLCDLSHDAAPDEFAQAAITVFAMALVAHLSRGFGMARHFAQLAGFGDVMGQGLFAING